jgi:hypothetical protein
MRHLRYVDSIKKFQHASKSEVKCLKIFGQALLWYSNQTLIIIFDNYFISFYFLAVNKIFYD